MTRFAPLALGATLLLAATAPAAASPRDSVTVSADTQRLPERYGSLNTVRLEYQHVDDDTTVVFTPRIGERHNRVTDQTAFGVEGAIYQRWSRNFSTRTDLFVAQDNDVFAHFDAAQDFTLGVLDHTTATVGVRYAEYRGDQDVLFLSIGARRYFRFGSVAYRLTRVKPDDHDAFLAHLLDFSIDDGHGSGQTRLWLSYGAPSLSLSELDRSPTGQDRGALLQRRQPLNDRLSLFARAGVSSYARTSGRITGTNFGLGLSVGGL